MTIAVVDTPVKFDEIQGIVKAMARSYRLRQRAERKDETRRKIVEAAIVLHETKGLSATSMSDVAKRAKVGKVTVYRHFPDEEALVGACSGAYFKRHPLPDLDLWRAVQDASERLSRGLRETYAYHRATEAMMTRVHAEAREHPVMAAYHAHWRRAADILVAAWTPALRRKRFLRAAIALALGFDTWRTLVREQGLSDDEAVRLMLRMTCDCLRSGR